MRSILIIIGIILIVIGGRDAFKLYSFIKKAESVEALVMVIEELRGSPKPRQRTPLHVEYRLKNGSQYRSITHLPLLQRIEQGDTIKLWVDPLNPQDVRLPLLSEHLARPLTLIVIGLVLMIGAAFYSSKSPPTSPISSKAPAESSST